MIFIENLEDPRINFYRSLRYTPPLHYKHEVFIAEGEKITLRLLKSELDVLSVFSTREFYEKYKDLIDGRKVPEDSRFVAEKKLLEQIIGYHIHSGIMAIGKQPPASGIENLSDRVIIANRMNNAENVGSIVRNMAAFGFDSIIVDKTGVSPYLRRAVRVSMGTVFGMKIHFSQNLTETISLLKNSGYSVIGAEISDSAVPLNEFNFPEKFALIFGSEGYGIQPEILSQCDRIVMISQSDDVDSLNVAASSAVFLYEISRKFFI